MHWLNDLSKKFLESGYLDRGVEPETRIREIAGHAETLLGISGFADKFEGYMQKGFYSLSSPVWSNFGKKRGEPVSCFGSSIGDNIGDILYTQSEVGTMSKLGGGTSGYFGHLRHRGAEITNNGHSSGAVHFMQLFQTMVDVVSQGSVRRGRFSPYLPLSHPDASEFLDIGMEGNPIQDLTHGVTVDDQWMEEMIAGDQQKRELWAKVIRRRGELGYPYILFEDNANNNTVDVYKLQGRRIVASNLCTEIMLPSDDRWSFVCVLSSMNLLHFDEWRDTDAVETLVYFLDAVVSEFLTKLEVYRDSDSLDDQRIFQFMEKAYAFAKENRALGLGVLGWHSYLQSKMIPFESRDAARLNLDVFKLIKEKSYQASASLAEQFGEPEMLKGIGRRNTTLNAVAPTTSSAFILGQVSQSVEPVWRNCYVKDISKVKTTIKNPYLEQLLEEKDQNTKAIWQDIRDHDGSVQHLSFLTELEKEVFKTFSEIDPMSIVDQAAVRQDFIDQGQSLNLVVNPATPAKEINQLYISAWKLGIKSLYYQHSVNAAQMLNQQRQCKACEA
ncbi:ribonucleoside-diphosphate reductase subunit alpha [Veronia nyctiphanis]|uniref:Ribonucleoside-diphosphate reductase subunit alpha n=1 Tax=Veronia nyctiphanis TaxID=1278244 RepID=A0A4Q0YKC1_9GAMM|nr:ribonucleoside-diphosphate reductase subunit alpha [Veronia nyctiphanis]RXJ70865.1 ribonucleoside-diphosphate reductase subunit alpha [Veronia nyctiphanis]